METVRQKYKSIYWAWKSMKQRCLNPRCKAYGNYGERGISVCSQWLSFEPFLEWAIKSGWQSGLDLDRIDNGKGYSPDNCHWVSRRDNINNRRVTSMLTVNGVTLPRTEYEQIAGMTPGILKSWITTHGTAYAERRLEEVLKNGYIPKDFSYGHKKPIIHLDSGKRFNSVNEASQALGIHPSTISNAMREHRATRKGLFAWEEI